MITALIIGKDGVVKSFREMPMKASDALYETLEILAIKMQRHVMEDKLSGQQLRNRTGNLRRSINYALSTEGETKMTATVGKNVAYAHIHEYGGQTAPHVIEPKNVKALRFIMGGRTIFAKSVQHPGSKMPERSFLRSSLEDMHDEIKGQLTQTITKALQL
jgi:phage gpG-like protein